MPNYQTVPNDMFAIPNHFTVSYPFDVSTAIEYESINDPRFKLEYIETIVRHTIFNCGRMEEFFERLFKGKDVCAVVLIDPSEEESIEKARTNSLYADYLFKIEIPTFEGNHFFLRTNDPTHPFVIDHRESRWVNYVIVNYYINATGLHIVLQPHKED